jgi:hypothetical protein
MTSTYTKFQSSKQLKDSTKYVGDINQYADVNSLGPKSHIYQNWTSTMKSRLGLKENMRIMKEYEVEAQLGRKR